MGHDAEKFVLDLVHKRKSLAAFDPFKQLEVEHGQSRLPGHGGETLDLIRGKIMLLAHQKG
jgi:hypothetical protein